MVARAKGKPDWHRMSLAVLKNRLLDITQRNFREADYGAANLKEFVENISDHVRLDPATIPPTVELIQRSETGTDNEASTHGAHAPASGKPASIFDGERIKPDLWKAVIDWETNVSYVWDSDEQCVKKVNRPNPDADVLPRLGRSEFDALRISFATQFADSLEPRDREKLQAWSAHRLPTDKLPTELITPWYRRLTKVVESRLEEWRQGPDPIDDEIDRYRATGDTLAIGELLARRFTTVAATELDVMLANAVANWASVRPVDFPSTADLIANVDSFPAIQLALAATRAASRLRLAGIEVPADFGDLSYRLLDTFREVFDLSDRIRNVDVIDAASAKMEEALAGLEDAVAGFQRTTSVTAKQPSIEVLRQAHRNAHFCLQTELPLLRDIDALLGAIFRKFCESCERHEAKQVSQRAAELRRHIERVQNAHKADAPYALWQSVVSPIFDHVSALIEEGIRATDEFTAPSISVVGGTFKLDLSVTDRATTFPVRIRNDGEGIAYGLRLFVNGADSGATLTLCEPAQSFDLLPKTERLVTLGLALQNPATKLAVPVQWTCATVNGKTCDFEQVLQFEQQSSQPDWDQLQANPPYVINPIKDREHLFGRDAVIADLSLRVAASTSTFLWGQKRVGKTSVLQVLAAELSLRPDISCVILRMAFHNTVPNNTLPIFWSSGSVNNRQWTPLLPRASF